MGLDRDNLAQISRTRRPEDTGKRGKGPQGAAASARNICVSWGTVGRRGIARIGSRSTGGDG